jgi:hypothetical protein
MARPKKSTKQQDKAPANKSKTGNKSHGQSNKGLAKKGSNSRKRAVSDGSDNELSSEEEEEPRGHPRKKARHVPKEQAGNMAQVIEEVAHEENLEVEDKDEESVEEETEKVSL